MLAIAKKFIAFSKQALLSIAAVGSIARWDLTDIATDLRSVTLELEARGEEHLAGRTENIEKRIVEQSSILISERMYLERILNDVEDALLLNGVPIDEAAEISIAFDSVGDLLRSLQQDASILARAGQDAKVSLLYDEAAETLHALRVAIDPWLDTGETSAALEHYADSVLNPVPVWERELEELGFEFEQDGFTVLSFDEFVDQYGLEDPGLGDVGEFDPDHYYVSTAGEAAESSTDDDFELPLDDVAIAIHDRLATLKDAIEAIDQEIPLTAGKEFDSTLHDLFDVYEELEELVGG